MQTWIEFLSFSDPGTQVVTLGSILLGAIASLIGCFTFLQKRALIGDTISHSVLPGICLAFILSGNKNPYVLLIGAIISGWISVLVSDIITRQSKLKADTSIAIVLSFFFAVGMMLLSGIQHSGNVNQAGLHHFLFGKAAAIVKEDVQMFLVVGIVILSVVLIYYRQFKLYIFDKDFAQSTGLPVKLLDFLLTTLVVLAISIGIRAVGVVLMSALLIAPAAAARFWSRDLFKMLLLAVFFGGVAGFFGAMISYAQPNMPTGPWIIIVLTLVAFCSIIFGQEKGVLQRWRKRRAFQTKVLKENILKIFYHLSEQSGNLESPRKLADLQSRRPIVRQELNRGLRLLKQNNFVQKHNENWQLTSKGMEESKRVIRLHRLWELYLSEHLNIASDHVHDDAEAIEHILTSDLQAQLENLLKERDVDPHNKIIPNTKSNI